MSSSHSFTLKCCCVVLCFAKCQLRSCCILPSVGRADTAGGESEPASAARRWLARNAAAVKLLECGFEGTATACARLVECLPALEHADLSFNDDPLLPSDVGRLLEALACCPRLGAFNLCLRNMGGWDDEEYAPIMHSRVLHSLAPFAKLRSLTKLSIFFEDTDCYPLADVVRALVSLTGLAELTIDLGGMHFAEAVVPAALAQLVGLRSLRFIGFLSCEFQVGCFDLPNLLSLEFCSCDIEDVEVLKSIPALLSLTSIAFHYGCTGCGAPFVAQLIQLPQLERMVFETDEPCEADYTDAYLGLPRLPADMTSKLSHLTLAGYGLAQFPLVLTQLVALEFLDMRGNAFAELPVAITALSGLRVLFLGRAEKINNTEPPQLHELLPLDARALGDLSAFPALCVLQFYECEVMLCASLLGVARHANIELLAFYDAKPAVECAAIVLQLSQALERLGRGSVIVRTL